MSENKNVQEDNGGIVVLRDLTPEEYEKYLYEMREKRLHDEASALGYAERKGFAIGYVEAFIEYFTKSHSVSIEKCLKIAFISLPDEMKKQGYTESSIHSLLDIIPKARILAELVNDGVITIEMAAMEADMTLDKFKMLTQ